MLPSLDGVRLKMQRAYKQIYLLEDEITNFIDSRSYAPTLQLDRISRTPCVDKFTIRVTIERPCPADWGVIVGEIIHDVRSALDHITYQLVIHATGSPPADEHRTQFPIFLKPGTFDGARATMLKGVSKKATALIKDLQPFSTGEDVVSPLWHLNQLSNIDKHRTLHTTGGTVQVFNCEFPPFDNPGTVERDHIRETGAFEHNTILASGRFVSTTDKPMFSGNQVQMKAGMTFDVVFDQRTPLVEGWSVKGSLINIADRSRDCIAKIGSDILSLDFVL